MTSNGMTSEVLRLKGFKEVAGGRFERVKGSLEHSCGQSGSNRQPEAKAVASRRVRQSSKPLMNRLETEFYQLLLADHVAAHIRIQAVKLKIGNGVAYTIDFFNFVDRIAHEVKGEWCVDDSIVKLKIAAAMYPEIKFVLAWKDKNKHWQRQEILP
jgi:hypothetical protein